MTTELFAANLRAVREAVALELGCDPSAFDSHDLLFTPRRPEGHHETFFSMFVTFGTGTVVCLEPEYLDFARKHIPDHHYRAFYDVFTRPLMEEAERRGEKLNIRRPGLGFTLATLPPEPQLPAGASVELWDVAKAQEWQAAGIFTNALDEPGDANITDDLREAIAVVGPDREPLAVAGIWKQFGELSEIGVDVRREARGRSLGAAVVALATRHIVETGRIPTYHCAATNVRSHRTALACGYVPSLSLGKLSRPKPAPP